MDSLRTRKIIHVDMDAFYASVEQRDHPEFANQPVAVGYADKRGVVATASYEARKYGVHSALPSVTAKKLCPQLIFLAPRFDVYRSVSAQVREIFAEHTDLIEPVSLDEAYLDVSESKKHIPSAWTSAQVIRDEIFKRTGLTASAGVSYSKFLAKIASDVNKPNGQFLITPDQGSEFIDKLPIADFHGIGPVTANKMHELGITNGADLKKWSLDDLIAKFGKLGNWYYQISRGQDDRPVESHRERKSSSAETTFPEDVIDANQLEATIASLADEIWAWSKKANMHGRTVTVKIKWADFEQSTRSRTASTQITNQDEFQEYAIELLRSVFPLDKGIRLLGVGVSNFNVVSSRIDLQTYFNF
jgi:DNA polymerase-4